MRIVYQPPQGASLVGSTAPPLSVETFGGALFDLEAIRGKGVLLNFWASWCGPCQAEATHLAQAWNELTAPTAYQDQSCMSKETCGDYATVAASSQEAGSGHAPATGQEIVFLGIAHLDTAARSLQFLETHAITYPNAPDPSGQWANAFGVAGIPETFFIGPDGIVHSHVRGPLLNVSDIQQRLNQIRPSASP